MMKDYQGKDIYTHSREWVYMMGDSLFDRVPVTHKQDGTELEDNFGTLPIALKNESAKIWERNSDEKSNKTSVPYFLSLFADKEVHCVAQSGEKIWGFIPTTEPASKYYDYTYKAAGKISCPSTSNKAIDVDNGVGLLKLYTPSYIILSFGTNDLAQGIGSKLGSKETMYSGGKWQANLWGYYGEIFSYYKQKFPSARLGFVLDGAIFGDTSYVQAMKDICAFWGAGILDMSQYPNYYMNLRGKSLGASPVSLGKAWKGMLSLSNTHATYTEGEDIYNITDAIGQEQTYDNLHPTIAGCIFKARVIAEWIKTL